MAMQRLFVAIYLVGVLAAWTIRAIQTRGARRAAKRPIPPLELSLMFIWFVLSQVLPGIYFWNPIWHFADYSLPLPLQGVGVGVFLLALWLLWRSHFDLGANWSPIAEIQPEQTLVTQGVYRYLRHPMYSAHLLWGLAQGLLIANWLVGWAGGLAFALFYAVRVPREEVLMQEHFGKDYETYQQNVGSILPRLDRCRFDAGWNGTYNNEKERH